LNKTKRLFSWRCQIAS